MSEDKFQSDPESYPTPSREAIRAAAQNPVPLGYFLMALRVRTGQSEEA